MMGAGTSPIHRVAVIGAGAMGAGIAAQFANAGIGVDLLDIPGTGSAARNAPAQAGLDRQLKTAGFMHPDAASLVRPGNIEDDLARLAEVDWIVEAVVERLDVKRDLYARINALRKPGSIVSSNTSTIPRSELIAGLGPAFASDFLITHFFNPPRIMRLLEIVSAPENDPALVARVKTAAAAILGKTVIDCRDTPGFIANRIGCFWLALGVLEAKRLGLSMEEADAVMVALGTPNTGIFGLLDLIGIDLIPPIWGSLMQALPADDVLHNFDLPGDETVRALLASGRFGRKSGAGFYRLAPDKSREALDLAADDYRPRQDPTPGIGRDALALLERDDKFGRFGWRVLSGVIHYAAAIAPDIAGDLGSIDAAMTLGYGWAQGPFALADRFGTTAFVSRLAADGGPVPALVQQAVQRGAFIDRRGGGLATDGSVYAPALSGSLLSVAKDQAAAVFETPAASLWDIGEGVACFELHTKLNSLNPAALDALETALDRVQGAFDALVIGNDDKRAFSAGADLAFIMASIEQQDWEGLDGFIRRGQDAFSRMKYAAFPVVAAVHGLALGGGCEFALHADAIVAHAELHAGLPEVKVGLVPSWGGCTQLLVRAGQDATGPGGPATSAAHVFQTIISAAPSSSAAWARVQGILQPADEIVMHRDHLLARARDRAVALAQAGYRPPEPAQLRLSGPSGKLGLMADVNSQYELGLASQSDLAIADSLATVLTGGPGSYPNGVATEADIMQLEREAIMTLAKSQTTRQRIAHMLATGKPLKN